MFSILLAVIYLSYISLGLPDSLLGAAWPSMQPLLHVPVSYAGILSMTISAGTVLSSLLADRLLRRFGTGQVAACSVLLTAIALTGFSFSGSFLMLCIFAVPYGLGAGAVDSALNHYVAVHYPARHMSWLHCFWGIGAAASPYIMSFYLRRNADWQGGYRTVAVLQIILTLMLFCSLPLWKHTAEGSDGARCTDEAVPLRRLLAMRGVLPVLITFFSYCAFESTAGLWASSYLVHERGLHAGSAARAASCYYVGITAGRLLGGFLADRIGDRRMIRTGLCGMAAGLILLILPGGGVLPCIGFTVIGAGAAPVYPCMIHATPSAFPRRCTQRMIGLQTASAYIGTTLMPALFGRLAARSGNMQIFPLFLGFFLVLLALLTEPAPKKISRGT
ncbi:MAG: MFS transporter [Oscillospiraceae bacterium]|nr:MFS transporter [Oscillospiraceae bacterium]